MASTAICSSVYVPWGLSLRPAPRLSRAIVWWVPARAHRCRVHACLSAPRPWISRTGGPLRRPVERGTGLRPPELVEQPLDALLDLIGELELGQGSPSTAPGTDRRPDL